jgi:Starch-binding associating with outer membrane
MKKITALLSLVAVLAWTGCSKFVEGYDVSPNSPSQVSLALLLSGAELSTVNTYTGQVARFSAVITQQQAGRLFQYEELQAYDLTETDIDNEWQQIYNRGIVNSQLMIEQAGNENRIYRGIGRVLRAMNLGLATDMWGDVPNTEAGLGLAGEAAFNPAYDSQESIIRDIQATLDLAIADLTSDASDLTVNVRVPGEDDFLFGGDGTKWANAARILKARYANRLSKRDAAGSASAALAALDAAYAAGFDGSADLMARFGDAANEWNQWYAFNDTRADYMTMSQGFLDMLANDPRLLVYAKSDTSSSPIGDFYGAPAASLPLATFFEAKFIEAEAALRAGNPQRAADAYNAAVTANLTKLGVADAAFLAATAAETSATITLEKIMVQKYIAMFTQPEVWTDWRRTGFPTLTPNAGAEVNGIPRRFPTAQNERLYNNNATITTDILLPVWWDQ